MDVLTERTLPPWASNVLDTAVETVQSYGWYMLIGAIVAYILYEKFKTKYEHHQVYSTSLILSLCDNIFLLTLYSDIALIFAPLLACLHLYITQHTSEDLAHLSIETPTIKKNRQPARHTNIHTT